ncbi:MAG: hypothetical protein HY735_38665 [Verrucomicrobia bacterium]|nr:hypothetical protein [Verrucomicrobiota bacterium]
MNNDNLLKLQAFVDDELTPAEAKQVKDWLATDAEARALCQNLRETKALLAANEPTFKLPETRELYWSKILREISRSDAAAERPTPPVLGRWWLRLALPFAGVALLIVLLMSLTKPLRTPIPLAGNFHEIETPLEEASAITFHSQAAGMTVVWIDSGAH